MKKIIGNKLINGNEYFKNILSEKNYTAASFTNTYNEIYPDAQISLATIQSLCSGRRSFAHLKAITLLRIVQILDFPDCSLTDYGYGTIAYHLVFGCFNTLYQKEES